MEYEYDGSKDSAKDNVKHMEYEHDTPSSPSMKELRSKDSGKDNVKPSSPSMLHMAYTLNINPFLNFYLSIEFFHSIDKNNDGFITAAELLDFFKTQDPNIPVEAVNYGEQVFFTADTDGDGKLNYTEFVKAQQGPP